MTPRDCSKWDTCSIPICPLDKDWQKRSFQNHEPVCFYLIEAVKDGAEGRFRMAGKGEMYAVVSEVLEPISLRWTRIKNALERAKTTGSRMATPSPNTKKMNGESS